ncbi:hypothetical protein CR513_54594, partial [Mucuna pruriens]
MKIKTESERKTEREMKKKELPPLRGIEHYMDLTLKVTLPNGVAQGQTLRRQKKFKIENKVSIDMSFKIPFLQRKKQFSHLKKSKLLPRKDDLFKIIKKINDDAYKVEMLQEFRKKALNLRSNFLQELEDDAYLENYNQEDKVEEVTPTLEGLMTKSRLQKEPRRSTREIMD